MWVTQTYLGSVEPDARVFVYYFFEDYRDDQRQFTERVQLELEKLGEVFGDKVSLLMPNPRYAGRIEAEVRENRPLWEMLYGNLPGLFVSTVPLAQLRPTHESCVYIPCESKDPASAVRVMQEVRRLASETLNWAFAHPEPAPKRKSFGERLLDAIELKPGIWGFKIDLRRLRG